jgi:hypothetical protein
MNMHTSELHRQALAHQPIKDRLWNSKPAPKMEAPVERTTYVRYMAPQIPLWAREPVSFDAHSANWKYDRAVFNTPLAYLKRRCAELNIPYSLMTGESRMRDLVVRRQLVTWEIIVTFGLSFPAVGRLMGGRDHTTCLHSFRKISAMTPEERTRIDMPMTYRREPGQSRLVPATANISRSAAL